MECGLPPQTAFLVTYDCGWVQNEIQPVDSSNRGPLGSYAGQSGAGTSTKWPPLLRDSAGSLFDHIDHDVRVGDRDGMR